MRQHRRWIALLATGMLLAASALPASAGHEDRPSTRNLRPMGHIEEPRSLFSHVGNNDVHTDIAFWGKHAFQGSWLGFNIRDISAPGNPKPISHTECTGPQGDMVVWDNILVRSWDSGAAPGSGAPSGAMCAGEEVPLDFAGLHIFDVSDLAAPELVGSVDLGPSAPEGEGRSCGSHTATGVPDLDNDRLLIYNNPSTGACPWIDVVEIPLDAPEDAAFVRQVEAERPCHDTGVILGDAMLAACAGGNGFTVMTLDPAVEAGASLDNPVVIRSVNLNTVTDNGDLVVDPDRPVTIGHSAAFSWDGEVLIFGHEPGGGLEARCTEDDPDSEHSAFFFEPISGDFLGMWTLPRKQGADENCTIHNYNVVPTRSGNNILVGGHYQAGTWVVDFTDPANAETVAWSDPPPEDPVDLGGAWSSYWYNNFIYETHISEGLNIFRLSGNAAAGAMRLGHLNPQTQEFTIP